MISQGVRSLAFRQCVSSFLPWGVCTLALLACIIFITRVSGSWGAGFLVVLLSCSLAYGYLTWGFANDWHGLIRTPKQQWSVSIRDGTIKIREGKREIAVPLSEVRRSRLVQDMGWEPMRGVEELSLVLFLSPWLRICIPGSSAGFKEVLEYIRRRTTFEHKELGR